MDAETIEQIDNDNFMREWQLWQDEKAAQMECRDVDPEYPISPAPTDAEIEDMYQQDACRGFSIPF